METTQVMQNLKPNVRTAVRIAIELNETFLGNFHTERLQKSYPDVIRLALSKGLKFSLGSDAHRIEDIGRRERICSVSDTLRLSAANFLV